MLRWRRRTAPTPTPANGYSVMPAQQLLRGHDGRLARIRNLVGVPPAHWRALYVPAIEGLAAMVQQLPASEAHHHSGLGGLLHHTLDSAVTALSLRRGLMLPTGAPAEVVAARQDLWTYACFTAALVHDIGKPLADIEIERIDAHGKRIGAWSPVDGPMREGIYRFSYRRGRRYRMHPRLPPLLVPWILPAAGLRWLASDMDVFEAWIATISGGDSELGGELERIVRDADGQSVARDLAGDAVTPAVVSRTVPLATRLAVGLRYLVDEGHLPLNRPGAACFATTTDIWLVSKRALDSLRDHLLAQGQAGIPNRNDRLMDELQQHGLLMPNGDRAVWSATVSIGDWSSELSMLRIPVDRLWPESDARPAPVDGSVRAATEPAPDAKAPAPLGDPPLEPASPRMPEQESGALAPAVAEADPFGLPLPPVLVENTESSLSEVPEGAGDQFDQVVSSAPVPVQDPPAVENEIENEFLAWLADGLKSGRLKTNAVNARVHFVDRGMLLVSPGIFRDFGGMNWEVAQKKLLKLKRHVKTVEGTNIWSYRVVGENKAGALLKGVLLPDPEVLIGIKPPRANPHLVLDASSHSQEAPINEQLFRQPSASGV